jgi:hypothetical protein
MNPSGWYVFQPTIGAPGTPAPSWPAANCTGAVIRIAANQIVGSGNRVSWSVLDSRLAELRRRSPTASRWQLQINVGSSLFPASWKAAGAKTLKYAHKNRGNVEMLLPWDAKAQELYGALMQSAARKYASDDTLDMVHVTFPQAYSPEMHMPAELSKLAGFHTKIKQAYAFGIAAVADAFSSKAVCLNLYNVANTAPSDRSLSHTKAIASAAKAAHPNLWLQINSWNAKDSFANYDVHRLLVSYGPPKQMEQVQASKDPAYGGTFAASLKYLKGAASAIIYPPDMAKAGKWKAT